MIFISKVLSISVCFGKEITPPNISQKITIFKKIIFSSIFDAHQLLILGWWG